MLSFDYRFHGHGSLRYVFKNGSTTRTRWLTLRLSENNRRKRPRFSVSISKKVMKSAVKRNRIRRQIYEIVRLALPRIEHSYDVVFIVTSAEILEADHSATTEAVEKILRDTGVLHTGEPTPSMVK